MDFKLPDIGEGIHEGEVVKWLVKEGDVVKEDQPIVQVMTDKATVEIPSPTSGRIAKIQAAEGKTALVGSVLVTIDAGGGEPAAKPASAPVGATAGPSARPTAPAPKTASDPSAAPAAKTASGPVAAPAHAPAPVHAPAPALAQGGGNGARKVNGKVLAAPATRKMARELNIDIGLVRGSGPNGRVTRDDIRSFQTQPSERPTSKAPTGPAPAAAAGDERAPLRGLRKKIAERMVKSKHTAAHFSYVEEVDVTELVAFRSGAKSIAEQKGVRLTYLPFIVKAVCIALKEHPYVNATLDDAAGEIIFRKSYHIGIATATDDGLIVPVVKHADQKTILQIGREIDDLANRARSGRATIDELTGSTFTITSLGSLGGYFATPIINWPEVAIMGVHKIAKRPWVVNNQIAIRDIMLLSLSLDHRVVDGAVGAHFMSRVVEILQEPKLLLLE